MLDRRVVVTGLGVISPVGLDTESFFASLLAGKSGIRRITLFDASEFTSQIAGEISNFDPTPWIDKRTAQRLDRFCLFGLAAAIQALRDSGLDLEKEDRGRIGTLIGTGIGGLWEIEEQFQRITKGGPRKVSPFLVPKMMPNACAGQVSIHFGLEGPSTSISTACASATHSIGEACLTVKRGDADLMVAGGAESTITPLGMGGFCSAKALSRRNDEPERASRPFDAERDGFVMGEGSGVIVLEEYEHARSRGAHIYGEFLGYGASTDASHITAPHPEGRGAIRSMLEALADAGLGPEDVSYVNAHGTSTELNDAVESVAIKNVFGDAAKRVPVSSTKSMVGHLLGASGGVEMVATLMSLERGVIHQTANYEHPDPRCDLDYVPEGPREVDLGNVMSNSFGFGGHNATLIFGKLRD